MRRATKFFAFLAVGLMCLWFGAQSAEAGEKAAKPGPANPFFAFAFDVGTQNAEYKSPQSKARVLKEQGYDGFGAVSLDGLAEMLAALDEQGLKLYALYIGVNLDEKQPKFDTRVKEAFKSLKGRETIVWVHVSRGKHASGSSAGDARAVEIIGELADMAAESGIRIALYPHAGDYVATTEEALRVIEKVDRKNCGISFNLCHCLMAGNEKDIKRLLQRAQPRLMMVTVNGADHKGGWDRLIQTLDRGEFNIHAFLKTVHELGFSGPIGLQCYGIKGDLRQNLARSMSAWRKLSTQVAAE